MGKVLHVNQKLKRHVGNYMTQLGIAMGRETVMTSN